MKNNFQNMDIAELINDCKKGNSKSQMEIYKRYFKAMYNIALRILNNSAEAEDVMQESFLSAFQNLETYKGEVAFGAWLKKIVVNRSLDIIKVRKAIISLEEVTEFPNQEPQEDYLTYKDLSIDMVKKALYELPEGYRIILSLYLIEGYDHEEISQILKISNTTSRTQYHRAKKQLAIKLNNLKAVS